MTSRTARAPHTEQSEPAVSDTQSMPVVEMPTTRLPYTADVLDLFRKKINEAVGAIESWALRQHDEIDADTKRRHEELDAHATDRIAQLRQAVEDIEAGNMLRIGPGPVGREPYQDAASDTGSDSGEGATS